MSEEQTFEIGDKAEKLYFEVFDLTTNRNSYPVKFCRLADRLQEYALDVSRGKMTRAKFNEIYGSWRNHVSHGNCFKLIYEMDLFVDELFGEEKAELRVIVAGSRDFSDYDLVEKTLNQFVKEHPNNRITIISGAARGADRLGERYAKEKYILLKRFPANWDKFGKRAGYIRNQQMLDYAKENGCNSYLIAFWDGVSKGTKQMIKLAKANDVAYSIYKTQNN